MGVASAGVVKVVSDDVGDVLVDVSVVDCRVVAVDGPVPEVGVELARDVSSVRFRFERCERRLSFRRDLLPNAFHRIRNGGLKKEFGRCFLYLILYHFIH